MVKISCTNLHLMSFKDTNIDDTCNYAHRTEEIVYVWCLPFLVLEDEPDDGWPVG